MECTLHQVVTTFSLLRSGMVPPRSCRHDLDSVKSTSGCFVLEKVPSLVFSADSSHVMHFSAWTPQKCRCVPLCASFQGARDVDLSHYSCSFFDDLFEVVTTRFLYWQVAIFPSVIVMHPRSFLHYQSEPAFLSCNQELRRQHLFTVRGQGRPWRTFPALDQ